MDFPYFTASHDWVSFVDGRDRCGDGYCAAYGTRRDISSLSDVCTVEGRMYLGNGVTVTRKKDIQSTVPFLPVATLDTAYNLSVEHR